MTDTLALDARDLAGAGPSEASRAETQDAVEHPSVVLAALKSLGTSDEGQMARNRLVISTLILTYFLLEWGLAQRFLAWPLTVISLFTAFSFVLAWHILKSPAVNANRRIIAMLGDIGTLSVGLYIGEEITACTWPIYLWVVYGNGFRFGLRYLTISAAYATLCFLLVILFTPFWQTHYNLGYGLLLGLVGLPLYARKLIRDLSVARQKAEEANLAKSQFLASVSHELRTPLNAIIGLSDLMTETRLDAEQREMLSSVHSSGRTLCTLINNLLDYSRLEAGAMPTHKSEFDLTAVVADTCNMAHAQSKTKNIGFNVFVTPNVPQVVTSDALKLTQVLTNLLGNAIKFTEQGCVTLSIDLKDVRSKRPRLRVQVSDTGIGIAPESHERIFQRFSQANDRIVDSFGGTGLGLAIVKQIIELLDGTIGVESELGKGATFWFEIPVSVHKPRRAQAHSSAPIVALFSSNPNLAVSTSHVLGAEGFCLISSQEQLEEWVAKTRGLETVRILLTDDDNLEAAASIRRNERIKPVKIICLTQKHYLGLPPENYLQNCTSTIPKRDIKTALPRIVSWLGAMHESKMAKRNDVAQPNCRPLSLLIAEDNLANQLVIGKILRSAGHRATVVANGSEALDALGTGVFDMILLDLNMPVMNGFEAIRLMRFAVHNDDVPIVAVTADATPETAERCRLEGFDATLTKPYNTAGLLGLINELTQDRIPVSDFIEANEAHGGDAVADAVADELLATAELMNEAATPQALDVLDIGQFSQLEAMGGPDFVQDIVMTFIKESEKLLRQLEMSAGSGDRDEVRRLAHAMKSCAVNVGAREVVKKCSILEGRPGPQDDYRPDDVVREVRAALDASASALLARLPSPQASSALH